MTKSLSNAVMGAGLGQTTWADSRFHSWCRNDEGHITQNGSSHVRDYAGATEKSAERLHHKMTNRELN